AATQEAYSYYKSLETPFEQTNDAYLFLGKVDYQLSDRHHLSGRYNHSNYQGLNATSVGTALAPTLSNALSNNGTEIDRTRTGVGQLTSTWTRFANELRGQYAYESRPRQANAQSPTVANNVGNFGTVSFLGQNEEHDHRLQLADNVTWVQGAHTFKFGGEFNNIYAAQTFGFNQYGQFNSTTSTVSTILTVLGNRFDDTTALYSHHNGPALRRMQLVIPVGRAETTATIMTTICRTYCASYSYYTRTTKRPADPSRLGSPLPSRQKRKPTENSGSKRSNLLGMLSI